MFGECCGGIWGAGGGCVRGKGKKVAVGAGKEGVGFSEVNSVNSLLRTTGRDREELVLVYSCHSSGRGRVVAGEWLCKLGSL